MEVGWDYTVKDMEFVQRHLGLISFQNNNSESNGEDGYKGMGKGYTCIYIYVGQGEGRHYVSFFEVVMGVTSLTEYRQLKFYTRINFPYC